MEALGTPTMAQGRERLAPLEARARSGFALNVTNREPWSFILDAPLLARASKGAGGCERSPARQELFGRTAQLAPH